MTLEDPDFDPEEDLDSDPDWDDFEVYQGPENELPRWLELSLSLVMPVLCLGIVFAICGSLLWILPYRYLKSGFALNEPSWLSWGRFITGGLIGVIAVLVILKRRPLQSADQDWFQQVGERNPILVVLCIPLLFWIVILIGGHIRACLGG